jgi:hypothetical protein
VGGVIEEQPAELPCTLDDGCVLGGATFDGLVPLPASVASSIRFEASGLYGERLAVRGAGLGVVPVAAGVFVESFPGARQAEPPAAPDGDEHS